MSQYEILSDKWKYRLKRTFEAVDLLICLSNCWASHIKTVAPGAEIAVIPNSVPLPNLFPVVRNACTRITFLGLIGRRKGIFDLLEIIKKLSDTGCHVILTIAGNGRVCELYREIERLGIAHCVEYLGWITPEERDVLMRKTDIFVLPSYAEGMPMSILEAMSYSIPVVSTIVGGIPEVVTDGECGLLHKPGDLDALYEKVRTLIVSHEFRRELGMRGRSSIQLNHNIDRAAERLSQIYNKM